MSDERTTDAGRANASPRRRDGDGDDAPGPQLPQPDGDDGGA
jgi:hypothetical protein